MSRYHRKSRRHTTGGTGAVLGWRSGIILDSAVKNLSKETTLVGDVGDESPTAGATATGGVVGTGTSCSSGAGSAADTTGASGRPGTTA